MKGQTGSNTCTIIHTRTKDQSNKIQKKIQKKTKKQIKKAKQCKDCEFSNDGFCSKYKKWSYEARIACPDCVETSTESAYKFHLEQKAPNIKKKTKKKKTTKSIFPIDKLK